MRLADDNGWTLGYAMVVAQEYRRFLVLTQVAGQPVSPSHDVDLAWHLHLTRTAHYEAFCGAVLGRFLHHEPARAGEGGRHRDMYRQTLAAYRLAFGVDAPAPTWPLPGRPVPAQPAPEPGWTVPPMLRRGHRLAVVTVLCAIVLGLLLRKAGLLDPLQRVGPGAFLLLALLATGALGWRGLRAGVPPARSTLRDRLEPFEAAWFSGGAERMTMTAIVLLTERAVLLPPGRATAGTPRPPIPVNRSVAPRCEHPAELQCLGVATDEGIRFTAACRAMQPLSDQFELRLIRAGIASDVAALPLRRARALAGLALLLVIEFERIFHAFGTPHRIGFLVLLTLAGVVLSLPLAQRLRRANPRSERALRPLRLAAGSHAKAPRVGQALAFGVALIGTTTLAEDLRFDGLGQQVNAGALGLATAGRRRGAEGSGGNCSSCSSCASDGGSAGSSCSSGGSSCGSSCGGGCGGGGD